MRLRPGLGLTCLSSFMTQKFFVKSKARGRNFLLIFFSLLILFTGQAVSAARTPVAPGYNILDSGGVQNTAISSGYTKDKYDPKTQSVEAKTQQILTLVLSFLGVIFLIMMVYGGVMWMTARGNDSAIEKAKNIIVNSIIGVIVVVGAYAITYFVFSGLSATTMVG